MLKRPRNGNTLAAVAVMTALGAVGLVGVAGAQKAKDTSSVVVATVNGEKITRGQVWNALLADQVAKLKVTDPAFQDKQRIAAGIVGALVVKKMGANPSRPVSVSPLEVMNFAFDDKSPALLARLEQTIQERAIAHEAKKQGVKLTAADVSAQMTKLTSQVRKQFPNLAGKSDAQIFSSLGIRAEYLRGYATTVASLEKLIMKETEAKLGHPFGPKDFLKASHILVRVNAGPSVGANGEPAKPEDTQKLWDDGKKKLEGILADIRSGKTTFEQAARTHSDDGSKFKDGDLGIFTRGQMVPEFDKAAFSQEKGKVGDPVKTLFGWHIIRVDKLGTELTGPERAQVIEGQMQGKIQAKVQEIMTKAKVVNKIKPAEMPGLNMPGGMRPGGAPR